MVAVASGGGGVMGAALLHDELLRSQIVSVVVDRECGATQVAEAYGLPHYRIDERANELFSDALLAICREVGADYLLLFFNRLLAGAVLTEYERRIVNLHASLLPAFRGFNALEQAMSSGARFVGSTVHFIDAHVDEGDIIMQSVLPLDPDAEPGLIRHRQFEQMCKGLVQTCHWLEDGRIRFVDGRVRVEGAGYDQLDFAPALEAGSALHLSVPYRTPSGRR
jgi:phosphoribosylglycinamide formyltransferase 1